MRSSHRSTPAAQLSLPCVLLAALAACAPLEYGPGAGGRAEPSKGAEAAASDAPAAPAWVALFDGKSLDGWTPKFAGHEAGVNLNDTFRVADGLLSVSYDGYESFDQKFGHLFFDGDFGSYDLRVVYRFVGEQCPGAPGWAFRNNGVMFHGQTVASMGLDQNFPASIEAQMLGTVDPDQVRPNGGVCTPGTNIEMGGELVTNHCVASMGPSSVGDDWVEMLLEVRGAGPVKHFINGELVHEYARPQLDPSDKMAEPLIAAGAPLLLERGTISVQAESHPIDFKTIEIRVLDAQ